MSNAGTEKVLVEKKGSIAFLHLGSGEEKIAVLTKKRMESLSAAIDGLLIETDLKALIITGASASGFCAGANIDEIRDIDQAEQGRLLAKGGQDIFAKIERLRFPSVALIRGACVGGGCELVLACTHRVLVDHSSTKIGLPEVKLGILPGFGGTQRLPRLVGVASALDIILKGKTVSAAEAKKIGLADELYHEDAAKKPEENFKAQLEKLRSDLEAGRFPQKRPLTLGEKFLTYTRLGRALVKRKVEPSIKKETKGFYPAPIYALGAVLHGLDRGTEQGYLGEARALGELAVTPVSKALIHVFRVSEAAGKLGRGAAMKASEVTVGVIGAGVMGAGIALSCVLKGAKVVLLDTFPQALEKGKAHVETGIEKRRGLSEKEKSDARSRLTASSVLADLKSCNVVIEAIIEDLDAKKKMFKDLCGIVPQTTLLTSNTSSLSLDRIFAGLSPQERFLGIHYFNPADKMPLVEVIRTSSSGEKEILQGAAYAAAMGKSPIVVEDVPGFLVNRILTPYLSEAAHLFSQGVSIRNIDKAATDAGMPMGPMRLLDEIGLDVAAKVASIIEEGYGERMKGPAIAARLLELGRKGKKSGRGFYIYSDGKEEVDLDLSAELNLPPQPGPDVLLEDSKDRLILAMVNEAVRSLDEGVAGTPGPEAACQIDLGSVMGLGFPPFKGGVMYLAETLGAKVLKDRLEELSQRYGKRFTPCQGIIARAKSNKSFYEPV